MRTRISIEGKKGDDITLITYGNMVSVAEAAIKKIETKGISVELVDLRTLMPLDKETILNSFKKTNRAIILHEARKFSGFGGEIASILMEEGFDDMAAPIIRIGSIHTPVPMHPILERAYLPQEEEIIPTPMKVFQKMVLPCDIQPGLAPPIKIRNPPQTKSIAATGGINP